MIDFDLFIEDLQTKWRRNQPINQKPGRQNDKEYPWILQKSEWELGLWRGIRSESSNSLPDYLSGNKIQKHDGVHNLKSSWILCASLYFPFSEDPSMLVGFLQTKVLSNIATVDRIELEYAEAPPFNPTTVLGEPHGQRGKNHTSPDVAFIVTLADGSKGLILVESKFTEHSFYECSGRKKEYLNPDSGRCMDFDKLKSNFDSQCYMTQWERGRRTNRKYWDYIRFSEQAYKTLKRCPAANAGYQLFRQQALAEAFAQKGKYSAVVSCVAYDDRNETLISCLRSTGAHDFTRDWAPLFEGKARFACFTHQQWVDWVRNNDHQKKWKDWLQYIEARYDYK